MRRMPREKKTRRKSSVRPVRARYRDMPGDASKSKLGLLLL